MLTLKERTQVLRVFRYFCSVNFVPVQVDIKSLELHAATATTWKALVYLISYGLIITNTVYKAMSLLYVLFFLRGTPVHQIMVHAVVAMVSVMVTGWCYALYIKHFHVNVNFLNMTLTGNVSGGDYCLRSNLLVPLSW